MDALFGWIEASVFSTWVRESPSIFAFPGVLVLHTLGMAFAVGSSFAIDLRLLGVASRVPIRALEKFYPVLWTGFGINAASGVALLIAYPTKALTNPVFYVKLLCIFGAVAVMQRLRRELRAPDENGRRAYLACASLALWIGAIAAGRLLAYTYSRLLVDFGEGF